MKKNFGFGFWFSSFFFVFFSQACRFANAHEKIQFKFNWNPIEIQKNPIEIQSKSKKIQKKKQIEKTIQKKESKKNQKQIEKNPNEIEKNRKNPNIFDFFGVIFRV